MLSFMYNDFRKLFSKDLFEDLYVNLSMQMSVDRLQDIGLSSDIKTISQISLKICVHVRVHTENIFSNLKMAFYTL